MLFIPTNFILDVDGVLSTGRFFYSSEGKILKEFGPHDSDGLKLIQDDLNISFVTADERGFEISEKRVVYDMGYSLELVKEKDRLDFFVANYDLETTIYMADGYHDALILEACYFGIAPNNARVEAKRMADFVTPSNAGEGAVLDACLYIKETFFD